MRFEMEIGGFDEIMRTLDQIEEKSQAIADMGLYEGAKIMADEVNKSAEKIKAEQFKHAKDGEKRKPSLEEKEIVMNAKAGIAKFNKHGDGADTSIGYSKAGYATLKGKRVPVAKIVNAINCGTSFMDKQPVIRNTANRTRNRASDAIKNKIEEEIDKITK